MTPLLDAQTVLTTLYCWVDDLLKSVPQARPRRPGPRWRLSDSEALTLAVLAQLVPRLSERAFLAYVRTRFPGAFPRLPDQSGYNRHVHDLCGVLAWLGPALAQHATEHPHPSPAYFVLDATAVSLLAKRRGARARTYGADAAIGRGGVDRQWVYGAKVAALVCPAGLVHGVLSAPANTEERFLAEALWCYRLNPSAPRPTPDALHAVLGPAHRHRGQRQGFTGAVGPRHGAGQGAVRVPVLADDGYSGRAWQRHWHAAYGATVLTRRQAKQDGQERWFAAKRQAVETVFARLHERFDLDRPRSKHRRGWWLRLSAKVAAYNAVLCLNRRFARPAGAHLELLALP